jgi:predicted nucleic acid-binding protein
VIFVDSNVIIDLLEPQGSWFAWSRDRIASGAASRRLVVNSIVVAECAPRFPTLDDLLAAFASLEIAVEELSLEAAFMAGRLFRNYRRASPERTKILADFLIGAHASQIGAELLTRDPRVYRRYFSDLTLITPETSND